MRIQSSPLLCHYEMVGAFQYRDLFQLLPPSRQDPHPPIALAEYGLTVEIQMDERACPVMEVITSGSGFANFRLMVSLMNTIRLPVGLNPLTGLLPILGLGR